MRRAVLAVVSVVLSLVVLSARPALAGPYADELAKCLVRSTTEADT
jgi:hypothetical protein